MKSSLVFSDLCLLLFKWGGRAQPHAKLELVRTELLTFALCAACVLSAQTVEPEKIQISKTETGEFPAGGTLRVEKSLGELRIEGWDQPGFEIATTVSSDDIVPAAEVAAAKERIASVHITAARRGTELVVSTEYPHRFTVPVVPYPGKGPKFEIVYTVRVPRTAAIVLDHHTGEAHIESVTGNIGASVHQGLITVGLPADAQPGIEARSRWGSVISDFRGDAKTKSDCKALPCPVGIFPFGHRLEESASAPRQKLQIRIGFGDIVIRRENYPPLPVAGTGTNTTAD